MGTERDKMVSWYRSKEELQPMRQQHAKKLYLVIHFLSYSHFSFCHVIAYYLPDAVNELLA